MTTAYSCSPSARDLKVMIQAGLKARALAVITYQSFLNLADDLGSTDRAVEWLKKQVRRHDFPIALNMPSPDGSVTWLLGPESWTSERLAGFAGGHGSVLEQAFGRVGTVRKSA